MKLIKRLYMVLFCALLSLGMILPAYAAGSEVSYMGQAEKFIFSPGTKESPTNLFPDFQNVIPGDTITQQILVKNKEKVDIKIYLRSLGADKDSEEFLSQLKLTVTQEGSSAKYTSPADEKGNLSEWVCLGTLKPGAEIKLNVTLEVPVTMGNEFQDQAGYIDWEFKVEEFPTPQPDDDSKEDSTNDSSVTGKNPVGNVATGDNSMIILYGSLMLGALLMLIVLFNTRRKSKNNN